jgi:hypothetical protein
VARAKRTDRSEARRRHRAQLAAEVAEASEGGASAETQQASPRTQPARSARQPAPAPGQPPAGGIRNAFREAFRPLNLQEDLRLLPRLLLHRAFWVPALIATVTAVVIVAFRGEELISRFAWTYFLVPPPIGGIFLAGFLAPRASYLIGAAYGLLSAVLVAIVAANLSSMVEGVSTPDAILPIALTTSPLSGIFFGAAAAWYRRFLYLASPARQARRPAQSGGRQSRGR